MIGIYAICFIFFPLAIIMQTKREKRERFFFEKKDTDVIKGIASCLVIFSHLILNLKRTNVVIGLLLNIFVVTGGMGVLIFFFHIRIWNI